MILSPGIQILILIRLGNIIFRAIRLSLKSSAEYLVLRNNSDTLVVITMKKISNFDSMLVLGFGLIVVLFSVPLLYLSYEFSSRFKNEIDFVRSEIRGIEQVEYVLQLSELLFLEKLENRQPEKNMIAGLSEFNNIKKVISQITKNKLNNADKLKRFEMIFSIKDFEYSLNKRSQNKVLYSYLQRKLTKAVVLISDESRLLLDQESYTYHLMELSLLQSPRLLLQLHEIFEDTVLDKKNAKVLFESMAKLEDRIEEMSFNVDNLKDQAKNLNTNNTLINQISNAQNQLVENYIDLLFYFESKTNNQPIIDQANTHQLILNIGQQLITLQDLTKQELRSHLVIRLEYFRNIYNVTMILTVLIWIFSITLSAILFLNIVNKKQSMMSTIEKQKGQIEKNAKLALLGEMATGIGHEIASPLTVISGMLTILERKMVKYPEEIKADLEKTVGRGHKMVDRINFIIKSMKGYAHQTEQMEIKPIQLSEAIEESVVLAKAKALKFGIELNLPENLDRSVFVLGTESEVCQCILNLVSNSIDAISKQDERKINIEVSSETEFVLVRIKDNGPGVPFELRRKIFESLFSTKQVGEGTGLGLTLVSRIIQRLGGKIELLDTNIGACFQLTFKKSNPPAESTHLAS